MNTLDYDYELDEKFIAQTPLKERDLCKLLVYKKDLKDIKDVSFFNIIDYLKKGDILVLNDTKVFKARLFGVKRKTLAKIELLISRLLEKTTYYCLAKPAKRLHENDIIDFDTNCYGIVKSIEKEGLVLVEFVSEYDFFDTLDNIGITPLPPYIKTTLSDESDYQTVYAKNKGSVAAPTAGFHFTDELLNKIKEKGIQVLFITLDVGLGTFLPVKTTNIEDHIMHKETYHITEEVADILNQAKQNGRRIIACGTTTLRTLEDNYKNNVFTSGYFETQLFLYPPYKIKSIDGLITNFHLPKSTLLMLVSCLIELNELKYIYEHAKEKNYRFFSFGDAMLII